MQKYELNQYLNNLKLLNNKLNKFKENKIIKQENIVLTEILGHIEKSEHNLRFVKDNIKLKYTDWAITGCYYATYHAALALIMKKGYSSKNHLATLLILIKEFYNKGLTKDNVITLAILLDYKDILFYVESKNKREDATYSTKTKFDDADIEQLRIKATLFISKAKEILKNLN